MKQFAKTLLLTGILVGVSIIPEVGNAEYVTNCQSNQCITRYAQIMIDNFRRNQPLISIPRPGKRRR